MNEWQILTGVMLCSALCAWLLCRSISRFRGLATFLLTLVILFVYLSFGGFLSIHDDQERNRVAEVVRQMLTSSAETEVLIQRIRRQLDDTPKSAQGWYLLGKLYLHTQHIKEAEASFSIAARLSQNLTMPRA